MKFLRSGVTILVAAISSLSFTVFARPRAPLPPFPESAVLYGLDFNAPFYAGVTNEFYKISGGELHESWSGYALKRGGDSLTPFVVPALDENGKTNVACGNGAIRFWFKPDWTSDSLAKEGGPGNSARLLEFTVLQKNSVAVNWSIDVTGDGSAIYLSGPGSQGAVAFFKAGIAWQSGEWHLLTLDYGTSATALWIDGEVVAQGAGVPATSAGSSGVAIGSTITGMDTAGGEFDEIYFFARPPAAKEQGFYFNAMSRTVALGPISAEEEEAQKAAAAKYRQEQQALLSDSESFGAYRANGIVTNCPTNGPVYITNIFSTLTTNGGSTVTFDIVGGTNAILYDIFRATNLVSNSITNGVWRWLEQGYTCNSYIYTNQPESAAFYVLGTPQDSDGDGLTDAYELLVSKTNPNNSDTDNDTIPDGWEVNHGLNPLDANDAADDPDGDWFTNLQEYQNGTNPNDTMVVAWGENSLGQCSVPLGLGNAIALAGGYNFSVALRADGTVVTWGEGGYGQTNVPTGLTNVTSLSANWFDVLAFHDGTAAHWGASSYGVPSSATNLSAVSIGYDYGLGLNSNGTLISWGQPTFRTNLINGLSNVVAIAAATDHKVALISDGTVRAWGTNLCDLGYCLTNVPSNLSNVVAISASYFHTLALRKNGAVVSWGYNSDGQTNVPSGLSNVVSVAAGGEHSLALKADGTMFVWGADNSIPAGLSNVIAIATGFKHSLAIRTGRLTPLILQHPSNQFAPAGSNVTFSAQGVGLAGVHYQWQFNGTNISGATNSTLTLTNVQAANEGNYRVIISTGAGSITSSTATFTLVRVPQISTIPSVPSTNWIPTNTALSVIATAAATNLYPIKYQWKRNGTVNTNIIGSQWSLSVFTAASVLDGDYSVVVSNAAGSTNVGSWRVRAFYPGMVAAWGANDEGQLDRPADLTNTLAMAAGEYHSIAVKENGTVVQWGYNWANVPTNLTNAIALSAGYEHSIALRNDGTVVAWGNTNGSANFVPTNLVGATAIAAGWNHNLALLTNGTVSAWGVNGAALGWHLLEVPTDLTNATAIAAGSLHSLALRSNGTVTAWGDNASGQTNVPTTLSNVVAIAAGGQHSLALKQDGTVVGWGWNNSGQCNVPSGLSNVMAIAAGWQHSVALKNDGSLVAWGDNSNGQTNVPSTLIEVKMIAANGDHTLVSRFSPLVQYPVDVSKDLLLIYNTNSADSTFVKDYYLAHRPMVANANVLGLNCPTNEIIDGVTFTNDVLNPYLSWLNQNPTKRPEYIVIFLDVATRVHSPSDKTSLSVRLRDRTPGIKPYVTHINMGGTNECKGYIDKLEYIGTNYSPGKLIIGASAGGYGNTNYVVDNIRFGGTGICSPGCDFSSFGYVVEAATNGLLANGVLTNAITYIEGLNTRTNGVDYGPPHLTNGFNIAGYICWGEHSFLGADYAVNDQVKWTGNSRWWIIQTIESDNGIRVSNQGNFIRWFSSNAFGGTNYSNTPVGAVTHVEEPFIVGINDSFTYFGLWIAEKNFAAAAWQSRQTPFFQAVGDPLVKK